jgi:Co/Zn/Cd efflux system component
MSSSLIVLSNNLNTIAFWFNRIIPPFQIVFGIVGNLLNMILFTRRSLRTNSCSIYFLASSVNNIFVVFTAILVRYLAINWNLDPSQRSTALCKLQVFFVYASLSIVLWLTVLARMDRFFL